MVSTIAVFAAAATLCAASPQQCALNDLGECHVEAPPAARDHLLLQLGASGGAAPSRKQALAALAAVSTRDDNDGPPGTEEQKNDAAFEGALEKVVTVADKLMKDEVDVAGGNFEKAKLLEVVHALMLDVRYRVSAEEDVQRDHKLLEAAIQKVAVSMDADEAIKQGFAMTSEDEAKVLGNANTAETTNAIGAYGHDEVAGAQTAKTWRDPDGKKIEPIHFCFASDIDRTIMEVFLQATAQYERLIPCITLKEVEHKSGSSTDPNGDKQCNAKKAIFVQSKEGDGCHSEVGVMQQPVTIINLMPEGCNMLGTVVRELGHALGMGQEESRADRDEHIKMIWENVGEGKNMNFETDVGEPHSGPFDSWSVFQDAENTDHKKGAKGKDAETMRLIGGSLQKAVGSRIGQRMGLSSQDVRNFAEMYGCPWKKTGDHQQSGDHPQCGDQQQAEMYGCPWRQNLWSKDVFDYPYEDEGTPLQGSLGDCVCHAHGQAVFKETRDGGCHRCVKMCPTDNTCSPVSKHCSCPPGLKKRHMKSAAGQDCYQCSVPEPTGTVKDATEMSQVKKLLALMPPQEHKKYIAKIEDYFAKKLYVTIERKEGSIKVSTRKHNPATNKNNEEDNLEEGHW